jgi:hypothetical protein
VLVGAWVGRITGSIPLMILLPLAGFVVCVPLYLKYATLIKKP